MALNTETKPECIEGLLNLAFAFVDELELSSVDMRLLL